MIKDRYGPMEPLSIMIPALERVETGLAWTAILDDFPIGAGGVVPIDEQTGQAWVIASPLLGRFPKWLHRTARACFGQASLRLATIEAQVSKNVTDRRWAEAFGFKNAGEYEEYPGYFRYVWTR